MPKKIYILLLFILLPIIGLLLNSCKTTSVEDHSKHLSIVDEKQLFEKVLYNIPQYNTVTAKCTFSLSNISSKAQIKMIKDKYVQISFQPLLGIELLRITLTPDSLFIINKMDGVAVAESIYSLYQNIPKSVGITEVQKLILGAPYLLSDTTAISDYKKFRWSRYGDKYKMASQTEDVLVDFIIETSGLLESVTLKSNTETSALTGYYSDYTKVEDRVVPSNIKLALLKESSQRIAQIEIKNITFVWNKDFVPDTYISSKYKKVSLQEIIDKYLK